MNRASADQIADRERDYRKHEWRPGDPPSLEQRTLRVAHLTAYLDTLLRMNVVPAEYREGIRRNVDLTRKTFNLPDLGPVERADA